MSDNRNDVPGSRPKRNAAEDFQLNITDEDFNTLPDINLTASQQSFSTSRRNMEGSNTQAYYSDKESKQQRKEHKKRDKLKAIKNRRVFRVVWWVMVFMVSLSLASYLITGTNDLFAVGRKEGIIQIKVDKNMTVDELTDQLYKGGAIKAPEFFKLYCTFTTDMSLFRVGSFPVGTNLDYEDIISTLQYGDAKQEVVTVTFPEGLNIEEVAALLEENDVCKAEDVLNAAKTSDFDNYDMIADITNADERYYKLDGYLFPDTYDFFKGEDVKSILGKMLNNFQGKITKELQAKIDESGKSRDEIVALAAIIQAEAADVNDMYKVSAVLNNRLRDGADHGTPLLQCDSTMFYPYKSKKEAPKGYSSKYNTYEITGLPAGAICNPGIEAIKAAVSPDPENSGDYYFCHSADGTAYYAPDAETHEANKIAAGLE